MSGWRFFAVVLAWADIVLLLGMISYVCQTDGVLPARSSPEAAGGSALLLVLLLLANAVGAWRLVAVEDRA